MGTVRNKIFHGKFLRKNLHSSEVPPAFRSGPARFLVLDQHLTNASPASSRLLSAVNSIADKTCTPAIPAVNNKTRIFITFLFIRFIVLFIPIMVLIQCRSLLPLFHTHQSPHIIILIISRMPPRIGRRGNSHQRLIRINGYLCRRQFRTQSSQQHSVWNFSRSESLGISYDALYLLPRGLDFRHRGIG